MPYNEASGQVKSMYYLETIAAIGLEVGLSIQINVFMKLNKYQRPGHYLTVAKSHSDFKIKTSGLTETKVYAFGILMLALLCVWMDSILHINKIKSVTTYVFYFFFLM